MKVTYRKAVTDIVDSIAYLSEPNPTCRRGYYLLEMLKRTSVP